MNKLHPDLFGYLKIPHDVHCLDTANQTMLDKTQRTHCQKRSVLIESLE